MHDATHLTLGFKINISTEIVWLASPTSLICKFNKVHGVVTTYRKVVISRLSWWKGFQKACEGEI